MEVRLGKGSNDKARECNREEKMRKVFLGGLSKSADEEQVWEFMELKFGKVESVLIVREKHSNKSRGCAYVVFETCESMKKALTCSEDLILNESSFVVNPCLPKDKMHLKAKHKELFKVKEGHNEKKKKRTENKKKSKKTQKV